MTSILPVPSFRSLRSKFLALAVPLIVATVVLIFALIEQFSFDRAKDELHLKLENFLAVQTAALANPLWNVDNVQVRLAVHALAVDPDIVALSVRDELGNVIAEYDEPKKVLYTAEQPIFFDSDDGPVEIGTLSVAMTDARIRGERNRRRLLAAAFAAVLLVSVIASSLIALRRTIGIPLQRLLDGIQAFQRGDKEANVDWNTRDEMGEAIAAFNDLLRRQVADENDLRVARDELEEKVETRTRELAAASEQLTEAIESIPDGFSLFDENDRLVICNTNYRRMVDPDFAVGHGRVVPGVRFDEVLRRAVRAGLIDSARGCEEEWIAERIRRHRQPSGLYSEQHAGGRWVRTTERKTGNGYTVAIYTDVTELERARVAAEAANESKSIFLAMMSHEIRTPMNGVLGMLDVLGQSRLSSEQRQMTGTIGESATALLRIIDDILDFSKIEAGELNIEAVPFAVRDVAESAIDIVQGAAEQKGLDLGLLVDRNAPKVVEADPVRLRQIIINLLSNAVKFTARGSVVVRVASPDSARLRFSVVDTGIGIPEDRRADLFKPFRQAEKSTTRRFGGTGLGLSISQRLVTRMGGEIGVESTVGRGSTFWFLLPIKVADADAVDGPIETLDLSGASILLVSASAVVCQTIEEILVPHGAEFNSVENPVDAEAVLKSADGTGSPIDVVIVDGRVKTKELRGGVSKLFRDVEHRLSHALRIYPGACALDPDCDTVEPQFCGRPPQRMSLLSTVGVAVGRLSADHVAMADDVVSDFEGRRLQSIEDAIAANQLILAVDDHTTNLKVIQRQLSVLGYASEVAMDGERALSMWQRKPYGLVLADCHMPVLDGFGLTERIRQAERREGRKRTPIVALTANALVGEGERCLNAGMDDYLAKPAGLSQLNERLVRWIGRPRYTRPARQLPSGSEATADTDEFPFDLKAARAIFGEVDSDLLCTLIEDFKPALIEMRERLERAWGKRDVKAIAKTAHLGLGSAGSVAATKLSRAFGRLEAKAKRGDTALDREIDDVMREADRVIAANGPMHLRAAPM
jgi:signal transduction histidine kinase/CheY-like chemotaxis protein/HAMP domain-containing protein